MFSLQVGLNDGTVPPGRLFEHTDVALRDSLNSDFITLQSLPVLAMPEVGDSRFEQVALIGTAVGVKRDGREHRFKFVRDDRFPAIPLATIEKLAGELGIDAWELRRTHWAVKGVNLFEPLFAHQVGNGTAAASGFGPSAAVRFPIDAPRDPKLVAVMMPFDPAFDVVYETIQAAVADAGLSSVRADDIWEHQTVMEDVSSLLWRCEVVVADLTGKNTNVFYEAGLAHALPRSTILLTQNADDVPFDLRSIRYLRYGLGTRERQALREQLASRLATLVR